MTRTHFTRGTALLLTLIMLLAFASPAFANEQVAATTPLNMRTGPGTNYPIIGELKKGQVVTKVGSSGSWSIILYGNTRVYAHSAYLTAVGATGGTQEKVMYATGNVNVRTGPGTGYKVLSTLKKGDAVSTMGTVGKWTIIKWNNGTAYMFTEYLAAKGGSAGGGTSSGVTPASGTMKATTNVNVRSGPGSNYTKLGALVKGELVTRTGVIGNWTQVTYRNQTAYVSTSYLTMAANEEPSGGSVTAATGTMEASIAVTVRSGPGTNYSTLGTLNKGDRVTRTGVIDNWTRINYNGKTGYVFSSYLWQVSDNKPKEKLYVTEDTIMRAGPSSAHTRVLSLEYGDVVILIERTGAWSKVEFGTKTGYVLSAHLSEELITALTGTAYAPNGADVRAGADSSYPSLGKMEPGEGAVRTGAVGEWTRIAWKNGAGYVLTSKIVAFTLRSQTQFTSADQWMYGKDNRLSVYTVPSESSKYLYGYISKGERVKLTGYNGTWSRIYAEGRTLYLLSEYLVDAVVSGPSNNDKLTVTPAAGTKMYSNDRLTAQFIIREGSTNIDTIPYGTEVIFREAAGTNAYKVYWQEKDVTVFISANDVKKA